MSNMQIPESFVVAGEANVDLSEKLHFFAAAVDGDKIDLAGDGGVVLGTIIESAAAGKGVTVQFGGIGKVIAAEAITANARIASDSAGKAVVAAVGDFEVGTALNTYASGEVISFVFASGRRHA